MADTPIVFAVRELPIEAFGNEHGRQTRKFVLLTIATHANSDGTSCYPGVATIARECGLGERGTQKVIGWLRDNGFLKISYMAGPRQSNVFTVAIPEGVNAGVRGERYSSPVNGDEQGVNAGVHQGGERSSRRGERYSSPNLPIPTKVPTKGPTKARRNGAPVFAIPDGVPQQEWNDYLEMRKRIHKPLATERACELAVKALAELRDAGNDPAAVLNQSVLNSWQGLFPVKRNGSQKPVNSQRSGFDSLDYSAGLQRQADGTSLF